MNRGSCSQSGDFELFDVSRISASNPEGGQLQQGDSDRICPIDNPSPFMGEGNAKHAMWKSNNGIIVGYRRALRKRPWLKKGLKAPGRSTWSKNHDVLL